MGGPVRWASPALAALITTLTVVGAVLLARPGEPTIPPLPLPLRPGPADKVALSLDRCATALDVARRSGDYPDREDWRPVAGLAAAPVGTIATVLDAPVPFVCVTGPTIVEVSDPAAAVPEAGGLLLLTTPSGIVATSGPGGDAEIVQDGTLPARAAPPGLSTTDRTAIPADRSAEALALLDRCLLAGSDRFWVSAVVLPGESGTESVLAVTGAAAVGGCTVAPDGRATPLRTWRIGQAAEGPRPFVWLRAPPGTAADVAAGSVQDRVTRLEVSAADGTAWVAMLGGRAFVTRVPPGVDPDPRGLTVRALDVDGTVLWTGPAAD